MTLYPKYIFLAFALLMASQATAQVPLIVEERAGFSRNNEPVTLGVPFARGDLPPALPVRIVDPSGVPVKAQFRPMSTWEDGSIKWLKCDFQASVAANSTASYALEIGTAQLANTSLDVVETGDAITVTTGPLRFVVHKTRFNLFDQAWLDLNGDGQFSADEEIIAPGASEGPVVSASPTDYRATEQPPERIEVEEQGPLKVVIKVAGRHYSASNALLKYETRIYAYAGQAFLRVEHVYANGTSVASLGDSGNPAFGIAFDRYALALRLNLDASKTARFGGDGGDAFTMTMPVSGQAHLIQVDRARRSQPFHFQILQNGAQAAAGARAEGWAGLADDRWGLLVSSRYFWQKNPKGVLLDDDGTVAIELVPTPSFLWAGMGTGDALLFYFHPSSEANLAPERAMALSKHPLFVRTTPEQYARSSVFYALRPGPSAYPAMDDYIDLVTANHLANREALDLYGNLHFGDVPRGQYEVADDLDASAWGNNYYDAVLTSARLLAQTGDLRHADVMIPMARHFMETAAWNTYDPEDWLNGFSSSYSENHRAIGHFQHHYGEGIWYYYYLTGNERAREVGLRAADSVVDQQVWGNENVDGRMAYQRASAVLEAWKHTRDIRYLKHARYLLVDKILATQDVFGLIGGSFEEGGFQVTPEQTFMMALFSDTVWKYLQEDPDPEVAAQVALLADLMDQHARKQPGREAYWNFMSVPNNNQPPTPERDPNNPDATVYWFGKGLIAGTYAYAYDLTGDPRYQTLAHNLLDDIWTNVDVEGTEFWGKASSQAMKNMLHAVALVEEEATGTASEASPTDDRPTRFRLHQNYPNPFNPVTTIRFKVVQGGSVTLKVYDVLGREVVTLVDGVKVPGTYAVEWDGRDGAARLMPSGVYVYRLETDASAETKLMTVLR